MQKHSFQRFTGVHGQARCHNVTLSHCHNKLLHICNASREPPLVTTSHCHIVTI